LCAFEFGDSYVSNNSLRGEFPISVLECQTLRNV
jgi:hypothetical protein